MRVYYQAQLLVSMRWLELVSVVVHKVRKYHCDGSTSQASVHKLWRSVLSNLIKLTFADKVEHHFY